MVKIRKTLIEDLGNVERSEVLNYLIKMRGITQSKAENILTQSKSIWYCVDKDYGVLFFSLVYKDTDSSLMLSSIYKDTEFTPDDKDYNPVLNMFKKKMYEVEFKLNRKYISIDRGFGNLTIQLNLS